MDNFLASVRSRQEPNLPAQLGYQAMAAIGMGVQAYRQNQGLFDRRSEKVTGKPTSRRADCSSSSAASFCPRGRTSLHRCR
jgi:hypothetical protein